MASCQKPPKVATHDRKLANTPTECAKTLSEVAKTVAKVATGKKVATHRTPLGVRAMATFADKEKPMEQTLQNLWAQTTLDVVKRVASKQGARFYKNDENLREDLYSWLLVKAQEFANRYEVEGAYGNLEDAWAGSLWTVLLSNSRWHWGEIHGKSEENLDAARKTSRISALLEDRDGQTMSLPAMHKITGAPELTPDEYYEKLEDLEELTTRLEHDYQPPTTGICIEWNCTMPALKSGPRCTYHKALEHSWHGQGTTCSIEGCTNIATNYRGYCQEHYSHIGYKQGLVNLHPQCAHPGCDEPLIKSRTGLCKSHYQQQRNQSAPLCAVQDCDSPSKAKGLCARHYRAARTRRECSIDGCTTIINARGLCGKHYKQLREKEKANG